MHPHALNSFITHSHVVDDLFLFLFLSYAIWQTKCQTNFMCLCTVHRMRVWITQSQKMVILQFS